MDDEVVSWSRTMWWIENSWTISCWVLKLIRIVMDLSISIGGWNSVQPKNQNLLQWIYWWEWAVVVDRNSRQRSILCDKVLGTTLCEFRSAREETDVTSWRSSCDDAMPHATALGWSLLATSRKTWNRWEKLRWGNSQKNQPVTSWKDLCADGMFRRCDQNQVHLFGKQRVLHKQMENQNSLW